MGKWLKALEINKESKIFFSRNDHHYDIMEYINKNIVENETTTYLIDVGYRVVGDYKELEVYWEDCNFEKYSAHQDDFFWRDEYCRKSWDYKWTDLMVKKIKERGLDYTQYINDTKQALIQKYVEDIKESIEEFTKEGLKQQLEEILEFINEKYLNETNKNEDNLTM